jgi:hypothetical protein
MKKIKHSKYKNTGILFELLVRQITLEVLNGDKNEHAKHIVAKYFSPSTELNKELRLYELLQKEKYNTTEKAEKFVDAVLIARTRINESKLLTEKYNLVKAITEKFDITQFLSSPVSNYKVLASIYKMFESSNSEYDVKDIFDSKQTLVENIATKQSIKSVDSDNIKLIESYKKQEKDLRLLTYKILVETFNKKYTNLDDKQKGLLKEYINNISNTTKFKDYISSEIPKIVSELKKINSKINDTVTKIKLSETISVLEKMKIVKNVNDNQVSAIMLSYELIKELKGKAK